MLQRADGHSPIKELPLSSNPFEEPHAHMLLYPCRLLLLYSCNRAAQAWPRQLWAGQQLQLRLCRITRLELLLLLVPSLCHSSCPLLPRNPLLLLLLLGCQMHKSQSSGRSWQQRYCKVPQSGACASRSCTSRLLLQLGMTLLLRVLLTLRRCISTC